MEIYEGIKFQHTFTTEWADLKEFFLGTVDGRIVSNQTTHQSKVEFWREGGHRDFEGCSLDEMKGWLRDGYEAPEFEGAADYTVTAKGRRITWDEEGDELDIAMALTGHDYPYRKWSLRPRRPGLRIQIQLAFLAATPAKVIAEYGAWCAGMIGALEQHGYDLEVAVDFPSARDVYEGAGKTNATVNVKRVNEASDFTEWSALFSPGGFRMLGFSARAMACTEWKQRLNYSYGSSLPGSWDIKFDADQRILYVLRPNNAKDFPADTMTGKLNATGVMGVPTD